MEDLMLRDLTFCQFFFSRDTRKLMDICRRGRGGEGGWGGREGGELVDSQARHAS